MTAKDNLKYYRNEREIKNGTCPICSSKSIINIFKEKEGYINGSLKGESWQALSFGSGYINGNINSEFKPKKINKCNDCSNEFDIYLPNYYNTTVKEILYNIFNDITLFLQENSKIKKCKYNPLDTNEKFFSLQEKQVDLYNELKNKSLRMFLVKRILKGVTIDTFNALLKDDFNHNLLNDRIKEYYDEDILINLIGLVK